MMKKGVNGSANKAIAMPQISSMTTSLGSFCASILSAAWATHVENSVKATTKISAEPTGSNEINRHTGSAASEPKVPGATGENPIKPPVARNIIVFCLNVSTDGDYLSVFAQQSPSRPALATAS